MKNVSLKFLALLIMAGLISSCGQDSSSSSSSTNNSSSSNTSTDTTTPTVTCSNGTGDEPGISTHGQTTNYYTLPSYDVIMHGAEQGKVVFNSQLHLSGYNKNIFKTDSRFNLRVIPRQIGKGTDSKGNACTKQQAAQEFSMMNVGILIRSASSASGVGPNYHYFQDIPVDCASEVYEFDVPATSDALVIEVLNVTNDQDCLEDQSRGITSGRNCPYTEVGVMECYALDIQFSTDSTKDIPH